MSARFPPSLSAHAWHLEPSPQRPCLGLQLPGCIRQRSWPIRKPGLTFAARSAPPAARASVTVGLVGRDEVQVWAGRGTRLQVLLTRFGPGVGWRLWPCPGWLSSMFSGHLAGVEARSPSWGWPRGAGWRLAGSRRGRGPLSVVTSSPWLREPGRRVQPQVAVGRTPAAGSSRGPLGR